MQSHEQAAPRLVWPGKRGWGNKGTKLSPAAAAAAAARAPPDAPQS